VDSDATLLQSKLEQIRTEIRLGRAETADKAISEILSRLEQDPAAAARSQRRCALLAEAKSLQGTVLYKSGKFQEAQRALQQAVTWFERVPTPPADDLGQFYGGYGLALALLGRKPQAFEMLETARKHQSTVPELSKYLGLLYKEKGQWSQAETFLAEAAQANSEDAEVRGNLAQTLEQLGKTAESAAAYRETAYLLAPEERLEDAATMLKASLRLVPDDIDTLFAAGEVARQLGDPETADKDFQELLRKDPSHFLGWICDAAALLTLGRARDALAAAGTALALKPADVSAALLESEALEQLGDLENAIRCLDPALDASPTDDRLLSRKINLLYADHRLEQTFPILERALEIAPGMQFLLYLKGRCLRLTNRLEEACICLQEASAKEPASPVVFAELASLLWELKRGNEAYEAIDRAITLDPKNDEHSKMKAQWQAEAGDHTGALATIDQALGQQDGAELWEAKGEILHTLEREDEALAAFDHVLQLSPGSTAARWEKARILRLKGQFDDALPLLDQVLKEDPKHVDALYEKGLTLAGTSPEKAVPILETVIELVPNSSGVHFQLARLYRQVRRLDDAIRETERCLDLDPSDALARGLKGQILVDQEKWKEGADVLQKAAEQDPDLEWVWADLGYACFRLDERDRALSAIDRALRLNPENNASTSIKGWLLMDLKRPREAAELLRKLTDRDSNSGYYHAQLGEALRQCEQWVEARKASDRAVALSPDNDFVLGTRADYLCDISEYEEAADCARRATAIAPDDPWYFGVLGWALENIGAQRASEALDAYRQAFKLDRSESIYHLKGMGNAQRLMGDKRAASETYRQVLSLARSITAGRSAVDPSTLAWCHYWLGQYDEAIRLYSSGLSTISRNDSDQFASHNYSDQFDLALSLLSAGRHSIALAAYQKGVVDLTSRHPWPRRALYFVGLYDLVEALLDPDIPMANSGVPEVAEAFALLKDQLAQAGRTVAVALPPPKPITASA
jgi:tetratricopeptide (TPR) repeat protein